jgi:hypothetical protein
MPRKRPPPKGKPAPGTPRRKPRPTPNQLRALGRPVTYDAAYHPGLAYRLKLVNENEEQIADWIGISHKALIAWKDRYPDFCKALSDGGMPAQAQVINALHQRAVGYVKTKTETVGDPASPDKAVVKVTEETVPPDLGAIKLYIANTLKRRGMWDQDPDAAASAAMGQGFGSILASLDGATRAITAGRAEDEDDED